MVLPTVKWGENFTKGLKSWSVDRSSTLQIHPCIPPVMRTGFSLCSISIREKPIIITRIPANENRFFPVWKYYTGKILFWPCTGPVRDCSVREIEVYPKLALTNFGIYLSKHLQWTFLANRNVHWGKSRNIVTLSQKIKTFRTKIQGRKTTLQILFSSKGRIVY